MEVAKKQIISLKILKKKYNILFEQGFNLSSKGVFRPKKFITGL